MSKSRARFLSELLGTTGLVKKAKSALAGADEIIDLSTLPSIPNSKLTNSSITINSSATSLGGSVTLTTANVAENTNLYYTNARADARITAALIDEDNMSSDSATRIPSQQSVKAYVDTEVAGLVDSAPGTLNTLNELAAALGDDANFSTTVTNSIAAKLPLAGGTLTGNVTFGDNNKAVFGAGSDLQIYHTPTGNHSIITESGSGNLILAADNLEINNAANNANKIVATTGGAVTLFHNNSAKLATTSTGIDVTGVITTDGMTTSADINFGDNDKAVFGAGSDLQIYHHSGGNSIIAETGTGDLFVQATNIQLENASGDNMIVANSGGAVNLYHNAGEKLATTSTGIDVTGVAVVDGLTSSATITSTLLNLTDATAPYITFTEGSNVTHMGLDGGAFWIRQNGLGGGDEFRINSDGTLQVTHDATFAGTITTVTQSASDNSTKAATTAYVTTAISNLVDSSPGTLNTLNELAAALGDDANFSTTVTNSIATKLPLAGGTLSGALNMGANQITNSGKITSTELTITGGSDGADVYINNTSPTLAFTDSNSYSDTSDMYILRGAGAGHLQFQFYDDSANTTTTTMILKSDGAVGIRQDAPDYSVHIGDGNSGQRVHMQTNGGGALFSGVDSVNNSGNGFRWGHLNGTDRLEAAIGTTEIIDWRKTALYFKPNGAEILGIGTDFLTINGPGADVDFRVESSNSTHALFVQGSDGNVGIGEATPNTKLEVGGIIKGGDLNATAGGVFLTGKYGDNLMPNIFGAMYSSAFTLIGYGVRSHASNTNTFLSTVDNASWARGALQVGSNLVFSNAANQTTSVGSNVTMTERLRVTLDGKVGIATPAPVAPLHVNVSGNSDGFAVGGKNISLNTSYQTGAELKITLGNHQSCYVKVFITGDWSGHSAMAFLGEYFIQNGSNAYAEPGMIIREADNTDGIDSLSSQIYDSGANDYFQIQFKLNVPSGASTQTAAGNLTYQVMGQFDAIS